MQMDTESSCKAHWAQAHQYSIFPCNCSNTVSIRADLGSSSRRWRVFCFNPVCLKGLDRLRAEVD